MIYIFMLIFAVAHLSILSDISRKIHCERCCPTHDEEF
jgi:hypothetical protein